MTPFRYLRDPLFLASVAVYLVNRFVLKPLVPDGVVHTHVNDVLCIPFWVPLLLWLMRRLGLRPTEAPPHAVEIVVPLVVWATLFEVVFPVLPWVAPHTVADARDVLAYASGALVAALWWRWWYWGVRL